MGYLFLSQVVNNFWPILCTIHFYLDIYKVFPVAIYVHAEKPSDVNEYFSSLIDKLNVLL